MTPKSSGTFKLLAAALGGIALIAVILAMAYPGGIGGLLGGMQGGQGAAAVATPAPEIPAAVYTPAPDPSPDPAPAPVAVEEEPAIALANVSVGDVIEFCNYDWRVLDVQGNQALIITDRVIDHRWYHHTFEAVTWETSEIRQWLNGEFFASFSPANQARIVETYVINNDNPWDFGWGYTPGGNNTTDRVFLLSIDELLRYFGDSGLVELGRDAEERTGIDWSIPHGIEWWGIHDQYSGARVAEDLGGSASWWWLRSPGRNPDLAAIVTSLAS